MKDCQAANQINQQQTYYEDEGGDWLPEEVEEVGDEEGEGGEHVEGEGGAGGQGKLGGGQQVPGIVKLLLLLFLLLLLLLLLLHIIMNIILKGSFEPASL